MGDKSDNTKSLQKEDKTLQKVVTLILDNFQSVFNTRIPLSLRQEIIYKRPWRFLFRYFLADFFISSFIIAPAVIAFWRGTWDYSLIYLEERLLDVG